MQRHAIQKHATSPARAAWRQWTTDDEAHARAAGRKGYNTWRRTMAIKRRADVADLLGRHGSGHGMQAAIARRLGVSRATVCRDVAALLADHGRCPTCGGVRS